MSLLPDFSTVAALSNPAQLGRFRAAVDPAWVEAALEATGTASVRRRRLPADQVLWLVVGMAMMRNAPISEVAERLDLVLPGRGNAPISSSAVSAARARLRSDPVKWLFSHTARAWATASASRENWRGLSVFAADGTTMLVPDSPENRAHFGGASAGAGRGTSGYPLVRVVALMAPRSHILVAARIGSYRDSSEASLARDLFAEVPDNSLTLVDRNFLNAATLVGLWRGGANRHWLTRSKTTTKWTVIEQLGPGDDLVEFEVSKQARTLDPTLPRTFRARAVRYQRKGFTPQTALTSLLDPVAYPAREIAAMYHERWEIELGYDEIKTEMLGSEPTLRSKSPEGIEQEIWGVLLAYNLVRLEMERVAIRVGVPPVRISFVAAYRMISLQWVMAWDSSPGTIPKHIKRLASDLGHFVLPPRRERPSYPRAVKVKMSNYARKRPKTATVGA